MAPYYLPALASTCDAGAVHGCRFIIDIALKRTWRTLLHGTGGVKLRIIFLARTAMPRVLLTHLTTAMAYHRLLDAQGDAPLPAGAAAAPPATPPLYRTLAANAPGANRLARPPSRQASRHCAMPLFSLRFVRSRSSLRYGAALAYVADK